MVMVNGKEVTKIALGGDIFEKSLKNVTGYIKGSGETKVWALSNSLTFGNIVSSDNTGNNLKPYRSPGPNTLVTIHGSFVNRDNHIFYIITSTNLNDDRFFWVDSDRVRLQNGGVNNLRYILLAMLCMASFRKVVPC